MQTLKISNTVLERIARLAGELAREDSKSDKIITPGSEEALKTVLDHLSHPKRQELVQTIQSLDLETKYELDAVVVIGRGDFSSFEQALAHAKGFGESDVVGYLLRKPIERYIPAGMEMLLKEGIRLAV